MSNLSLSYGILKSRFWVYRLFTMFKKIVFKKTLEKKTRTNDTYYLSDFCIFKTEKKIRVNFYIKIFITVIFSINVSLY